MTIHDFHQDAKGHWFALLACGHSEPVRHRPPYINRGWLLTEEGRAGQIGKRWRCRECEQRRAA